LQRSLQLRGIGRRKHGFYRFKNLPQSTKLALLPFLLLKGGGQQGLKANLQSSGSKRKTPRTESAAVPGGNATVLLAFLHWRTRLFPSCLMNLHRLSGKRCTPFGNQGDCIAGTAEDTDFAHYAASGMKAQRPAFLIDINRIGGTPESAHTTKRTLLIIKDNVASGVLERLSHLHRVEPRCRTIQQIPQDGR
jgi:hypothetical protein